MGTYFEPRDRPMGLFSTNLGVNIGIIGVLISAKNGVNCKNDEVSFRAIFIGFVPDNH